MDLERKVLQTMMTRRIQRDLEGLFREAGQVVKETGISLPEFQKLVFEFVEEAIQTLKEKYLK
jgi:hypothetical protein